MDRHISDGSELLFFFLNSYYNSQNMYFWRMWAWPQSLSRSKWAKQGRVSLNSAHEQWNWQYGKRVCVLQWSSRLLSHAQSKIPFGDFIFDTEEHSYNIYFMLTKVVEETLKNQLVSQSFCWIGHDCWVLALVHSLYSRSKFHTIIITSFTLQ